jgi:hypothetical protein
MLNDIVKTWKEMSSGQMTQFPQQINYLRKIEDRKKLFNMRKDLRDISTICNVDPNFFWVPT